MDYSEWKTVKWGDLVELKYGKALKGYKDKTSGVRVFGTNGPIGYTDKALGEGPTIIIGRKGAYRGVHYTDEDFYVIDTAYYLVPKVEMNLKWAYYDLILKDINSLDSGSAIPSTSREDFYSIETRFPPIEVQNKIAYLTSLLDKKAKSNVHSIGILEEISQTLFKRWFNDFEFPNEEGLPYKSSGGKMVDSELGEIPEGWVLKSLYDLADYINGTSFKRKEIDDRSGLPIIKIAELKNGITESTKRFNGSKHEKYTLKNGDILFSWSGNPDTSIDTFIWHRGKGILNQHIFKVVPYIYDKEFMFLILKFYKSVFTDIASNKQTTGLGHVTVSDLKRIKIALPNETLVNEFIKIIKPLINSMYMRNIENISLEKIRDTLLPKLLSGEIEIPDESVVV